MKLNELLRGLTVLSATADMEMEISDVSYDSRATKQGDLFVAMTGFAVDGHTFIGKAAAPRSLRAGLWVRSFRLPLRSFCLPVSRKRA